MAALGLPALRGAGGVWQAAIALRPYPGEAQCGDQAGVWCLGEGRLLLALADGLGHGSAAVEAAMAAMACVDTAPGMPLAQLMRRCDEALRSTRGAALSLIRLDLQDRSLVHAGVGNVSVALRAGAARRRLASVPGIVGAGLPVVRVETLALERSGTLAHFTDGVDPLLDLGGDPDAVLAAQADRLLARHARPLDDAGLVLLRWQAEPSIPADRGQA